MRPLRRALWPCWGARGPRRLLSPRNGTQHCAGGLIVLPVARTLLLRSCCSSFDILPTLCRTWHSCFHPSLSDFSFWLLRINLRFYRPSTSTLIMCSFGGGCWHDDKAEVQHPRWVQQESACGQPHKELLVCCVILMAPHEGRVGFWAATTSIRRDLNHITCINRRRFHLLSLPFHMHTQH